ncbi:glycine cleavage system protein H [Blattabacterium cuenoti]|uniref:glycine cleavage system protein H n=1 Tax=Blattabacterium cuenoti TaxID=1653831 RepID=UPI00163C6777|nr:glycine cleavage system H protein [Blattabacterium cuenoti]
MYPDKLKYTKNHEWIKLIHNNNKKELIKNSSASAHVGITFFAQKELGDIIFLDISKSLIGNKKKQGETFGTIEAVKTVSDLFMPVSGKIININNELVSKPELVNKDSYKYWVIKIEISNIEEYNRLMSKEEYEKYFKS